MTFDNVVILMIEATVCWYTCLLLPVPHNYIYESDTFSQSMGYSYTKLNAAWIQHRPRVIIMCRQLCSLYVSTSTNLRSWRFFYVWLLLFSNRSFPPCCIAIDTLGFIHRGQSIQYIPGMMYTSLFVGICFSLLSEDFTHIFPCHFADPGAITRQLYWQWIYPKCYREIHHGKLQDVVT